MDIIEKRIKDTKVAYAQFKGSYDQIPDHMQEVGEWVMDEGLKMTGMVYGSYFNSPEEVPEEDTADGGKVGELVGGFEHIHDPSICLTVQ